MESNLTIEVCSCEDLERELEGLAILLHESVQQGASIGFILPHDLEDSRRFWQQQVRPALLDGQRILLVAKLAEETTEEIAGAVQLNLAMPDNQAHRAEVSKLLVHPGYRKRGIGKALMEALETAARQLGRGLLSLDTAGAEAERLYARQGFEVAGKIPDYARAALEARLEPTTFMYKQL